MKDGVDHSLVGQYKYASGLEGSGGLYESLNNIPDYNPSRSQIDYDDQSEY